MIHLMPRPRQVRTFGCMDVAVFAGVMSTGLFAMSYLPMLMKAARTKDLSSYSLGNLAMTNVGNAVHSVYVFSLPVGPIWFLHTFYLVASVLMLVWFLRYRQVSQRRQASPLASARSAEDQYAGRGGEVEYAARGAGAEVELDERVALLGGDHDGRLVDVRVVARPRGTDRVLRDPHRLRPVGVEYRDGVAPAVEHREYAA